MNDITVRRPRPLEMPAVHLLLASALHTGSEVAIAALQGPPFIAGAAAYVRLPHRAEELHVEVVRSCRRNGIGRQLAEYACTSARGHGCGTLHGWASSDQACAFAEAAGFTRGVTSTSAEAAVEETHRWLGRHSLELPEGLRRVPLSECREQVADLWESAVAPGRTAHLLASGAYDDLSVCVTNTDGEVAAFLLASRQNERYHVAGQYAASRYRASGRLALWTCAEVLRDCSPTGRVTFEWIGDVRWTRRIAERLGAKVVAVRTSFTKELA